MRVLLILIVISISFGNTILVPQNYSTIQGGIDAASDGDTVLVSAGTYVENISNTSGDEIIILSVEGSSFTTIEGNGNNQSVVTLHSGEINGFSITEGYTSDNNSGGGITAYSSRIINCNVNNNHARYGAGIHGNNLQIHNSNINNNSADVFNSSRKGGGIYITSGTNIISSTIISGNYVSAFNGGASGGGIYIYIMELFLSIVHK